MRLGGWFGANSIQELDPLCEKLDTHGLSAINAPGTLSEMDDDACAAFGEKARSLGIVVGEAGFWENLMTDDAETRTRRIDQVRRMLHKADIMGCGCIVTLVGTKSPSDRPLAPHPYMYSDHCKKEFRQVVLRVLDGLDLQRAKYVIEPWHNTFFYQPEDIREFIDSVDHHAFGLHLDQMKLVNQEYFFHTTDLINKTFDLLAEKVFSVHLKDIRCDETHMFLKWDEVYIGDGVLDYETYLRRLDELPAETPCYCEHMSQESDFTLCFERLHRIADRIGVRFLRRNDAG